MSVTQFIVLWCYKRVNVLRRTDYSYRKKQSSESNVRRQRFNHERWYFVVIFVKRVKVSVKPGQNDLVPSREKDDVLTGLANSDESVYNFVSVEIKKKFCLV